MTSDKHTKSNSKLLRAIRARENLWNAWFHVSPRARLSSNPSIRAEAATFRANASKNIGTLQYRLQSGTFSFAPQRGVTKSKGGNKRRAIVVSPLENRIVQRAILNVLQAPPTGLRRRIAPVTEVLETPTSVGGIPKKGVPQAIALINAAIAGGATHYFRSDIRSFFDRVDKSAVIDFLQSVTQDQEFINFFEQALRVELENSDEIKQWLDIFPSEETGVPQGSALSAFCGNVLLRNFDSELNSDGVVTVRYIDDFVVLAKSHAQIQEAKRKSKEQLEELGLSIYEPDGSSTKSSIGRISSGFSFLSYKFRDGEISISNAKSRALIIELKDEFKRAKHSIFSDANSKRKVEERYAQFLARIDGKIRGWGESFAYCTQRVQFAQLDTQIDELIVDFDGWYFRKLTSISDPKKARRIRGLFLLADVDQKRA